MKRGDQEQIVSEIDLRRAAVSYQGDAAEALEHYETIKARGGRPVVTWSYNRLYRVRDADALPQAKR